MHLTVTVPGVHLPIWSVAALALAFIFTALALLLSIQELSDLRKEIRMLQLHTQDVENVLIRAGSAKREDFAPWGPEETSEHRREKE